MADEQATRPSYRHAFQIFAVVAVVVAVALAARWALVPRNFGQYGAYRGAAVAEARQRSPRHLGEAGCVRCHERVVKLHDKDAHYRVECEVCHGPGAEHAKKPKQARLARPKGKALCLTCHQTLAARPGPFPQVSWREHYKFVGVKGDQVPCTRCHDPHEPLYMDRDLRQARLHPLVHRCRDCHAGSARDPAIPRPAAHPAIFECRTCHAEIAADAARRPHGKVRCSTCHLFFKQSDFAGRIIRDADPRFCLLCHREGDFRSDKAPPSIAWPGHREDVAQGPEDAAKRCIDCHRDRIHRIGPRKEGKDGR